MIGCLLDFIITKIGILKNSKKKGQKHWTVDVLNEKKSKENN